MCGEGQFNIFSLPRSAAAWNSLASGVTHIFMKQIEINYIIKSGSNMNSKSVIAAITKCHCCLVFRTVVSLKKNDSLLVPRGTYYHFHTTRDFHCI